uniref:Defective in cullin neddylation protein n=1 Tax=Panagrellus redivivus TaxID=6233 RepID=A0A7E4WAZ2_PANRE
MSERWSMTRNAPITTGQKRHAPDDEAVAAKRAKTNEKQQQKKIDAFYQKYANEPKDTLPGRIGPHGVKRLCRDLKVQPTDLCMLVLAWKLEATVSCEFMYAEWSAGMKKIDCTGIRALTKWCSTADLALANPADFKKLYDFTFNYAKPLGQRSLPIELAIACWRLLYRGNADVEQWITYLGTTTKLGITSDEWTSFYDFHSTVNINNYDAAGAFPIIIDDYVEWRLNQMRME